MRRLYDSRAIQRNDDEPFAPNETDETPEPQSFRSIPVTSLSRFLPTWLRDRALSVELSTPRTEYPLDAPVPFQVTVRNGFPMPILVRTPSPVLWSWSVDGLSEAAHVTATEPPDDPRWFRFGRGERKQFSRRWDGRFRIAEREWEPAEPGQYTIRAGLNVPAAEDRGLVDETSVRLRPG